MSDFRQCCLSILRLNVVTREDFNYAIHHYLNSYSTYALGESKTNYRFLQAVRSKYMRTSFHSDHQSYHKKAPAALRSHDRIGSLFSSCQVHKSGVGRSGGHYPERYSKSAVSDLFGYGSGLESLGSPSPGSSRSRGRLLIQKVVVCTDSLFHTLVRSVVRGVAIIMTPQRLWFLLLILTTTAVWSLSLEQNAAQVVLNLFLGGVLMTALYSQLVTVLRRLD